MSERIGPCPRCGVLPRLRPNYGDWVWECGCPPPVTWTSNNTGPDLTIDSPVKPEAGD